MTLSAVRVNKITNFLTKYKRVLLDFDTLNKTGVATPPDLETDITDQVAAKMKEIKDYYLKVHPDRTVYISTMNQLKGELESLVSTNDGIRDRNQARWDITTASFQLQYDTMVATIDHLDTKIKNYIDSIELDPT